MKILKKLVLAAVVGSVLSCTTKKSDDPVTTSCSFASMNTLARTSTYGVHDTSTNDQCEQFAGTTSLWTGMSTSSTALVALPSAIYNSGATCGTCLSIQGASATVIARVIGECSGCAADVIDMDEDGFETVTGISTGSGYGNITVAGIPCPTTENVKVWMNSGTNPFYLNIALANHATPIKKVEVDAGIGSGFQEMARVGTTGAFALSLGAAASATGQIRLTDDFDQVITGTFDTPVSSSTLIGSQFGTCN